MQFPFSKYLSGDMHEVQCELVSSDGPSHVLQSEWHFSHLLSTVYVELGQISTHFDRYSIVYVLSGQVLTHLER